MDPFTAESYQSSDALHRFCDTTELHDPGSNFTTFQMRERKIRFCSPFSYSVTALTATLKMSLWPYHCGK